MSGLLLTIGNKNYSSWSLRPWMLMKHLGLEFEESVIPLDTPEFARDIAAISPTRRVPVLQHGSLLLAGRQSVLQEVTRGDSPADLAIALADATGEIPDPAAVADAVAGAAA